MKNDETTRRMKEITVPAVLAELNQVIAFVSRELEDFHCPTAAQMQIELAVEELYVNIANYAYQPEDGDATVRLRVEEDPLQVTIQFLDSGKPYNPLEKPDPDVALPAKEREIGGLGIFLVKKNMDEIAYEYKDGKNVLTVKKKME